MPRHSGFKLKCTKVAETPTQSSPIEQGEEGKFYLMLASWRMLRGKKVMSQDFFLLTTLKGKMQHIRVPLVTLPKIEDFSSR